MERIKNFYLELIKDDEFKARLAQFRQENGDDYEKIIEKVILPEAKKRCYNFTKEELLTYENKSGENGLSDEELLDVAGGFGKNQMVALSLGAIMGLSAFGAAASNLFGGQNTENQSMSAAAPDTSISQMADIETPEEKAEEKSGENQDISNANTGGTSLQIQNNVAKETQKDATNPENSFLNKLEELKNKSTVNKELDKEVEVDDEDDDRNELDLREAQPGSALDLFRKEGHHFRGKKEAAKNAAKYQKEEYGKHEEVTLAQQLNEKKDKLKHVDTKETQISFETEKSDEQKNLEQGFESWKQKVPVMIDTSEEDDNEWEDDDSVYTDATSETVLKATDAEEENSGLKPLFEDLEDEDKVTEQAAPVIQAEKVKSSEKESALVGGNWLKITLNDGAGALTEEEVLALKEKHKNDGIKYMYFADGENHFGKGSENLGEIGPVRSWTHGTYQNVLTLK